MRCFTTTSSARLGVAGNTFNIMSIAKWALVASLLVAGFTGEALAARERKDNPWLILPPGAPARSEEGHLKQNLGERDFVRFRLGLAPSTPG